MTTTVVTTSHTATLGADIEDQVKFSQPWSVVKVTATGTGTIWIRTDGTAATVSGTNCRPVGAGLDPIYLLQNFDGLGAYTLNPVSLISSGTPGYTVEGVNLPSDLAATLATTQDLTDPPLGAALGGTELFIMVQSDGLVGVSLAQLRTWLNANP